MSTQSNQHIQFPFQAPCPFQTDLNCRLDALLEGLDPYLVGDLKQSAFQILQSHMRPGTPGKRPDQLNFAEAFLHVLVNLAQRVDGEQRGKSLKEKLIDLTMVEIEQEYLTIDFVNSMMARIKQVSPSAHNAVLLKHVAGYTLDESADILNMSVQQVRTALKRGRQVANDFRGEIQA